MGGAGGFRLQKNLTPFFVKGRDGEERRRGGLRREEGRGEESKGEER